MDSKLLVTITTVTFNSEKTLSKAIESVLNQTYPYIEYIIKDGASTDETLEIANSYKSAFENKGYLFKVISSQDEGMYDALNQANNAATGEIIGNVNADDYFELNAVETVVDEYKKNPFDMIYADLRVISDKHIKIKKAKLKKFISSRHWNHPTTFIRRTVLLKEKYACKTMYDDFDLMLRLRKNYKVVIINKVLSNFVFGGMSNKKSVKEALRRIKIKRKVYRDNGYKNLLYTLDTCAIEFAKIVF